MSTNTDVVQSGPISAEIEWLTRCCTPLEPSSTPARNELVGTVCARADDMYQRLRTLQQSNPQGHFVIGDLTVWGVFFWLDLLIDRQEVSLGQRGGLQNTLVALLPELLNVVFEYIDSSSVIRDSLFSLNASLIVPSSSVEVNKNTNNTANSDQPTLNEHWIWTCFQTGALPGGVGSDRSVVCSEMIKPKISTLLRLIDPPNISFSTG